MSCFPCFSSHGKAAKRTKSGRREQSVSLHSRSNKHNQQHQPLPQQHHHHAPAPPPRPTPTGSIYFIFYLYFYVNAEIGLEILNISTGTNPTMFVEIGLEVEIWTEIKKKKNGGNIYPKPSFVILGHIINLDFSFQKVPIYIWF